MCGIAGILSRDRDVLKRIQAMTDVQAHRGPDGAGFLLVGSKTRMAADRMPEVLDGDFLALGHRRLAIIDRSSAAAQPMASADGMDWICFNGEIYNYLELRAELSELGFLFRSRSDTEVILAAYRAWGIGCFRRFNGMWSIAIWDGRTKTLVLSRDRLGIKPLYVSCFRGTLAFSSEIKAILVAARVRPRLNLEVAIDYLKWSMVNHRHDTFIANITAFPPAHYAIVDERALLIPEPYWSAKVTRRAKSTGRKAAATQFAALFKESVELHMRSDVAVGSCLSGGLDSSAVVCQMGELTKGESDPLHTFHAGSGETDYNEIPWCNLVNESLGAKAYYVYPTAEGFAAELDNLIWHQEEPFTSTSVYAQWTVMRCARDAGIKVLLDGQGGDEVLCGYRKYYLFYLRELLKNGDLVTFVSEALSLIRHGDRGYLRWRDARRYLPTFLRRGGGGLSAVLTPEGAAAWASSRLELGPAESVAHRQLADLKWFSVPSLLRYQDRNSMAWGVECRVPFLEYRLIEWLLNVEPGLKLRNGRTKAVMRDGLRGLVPNPILNRRDKMGFEMPQESWMRGSLRTAIDESFESSEFRLSKIINYKALRRAVEQWQSGNGGLEHSDVFRLFIFARWLKRFDVDVC